jgi:hypothetical protein
MGQDQPWLCGQCAKLKKFSQHSKKVLFAEFFGFVSPVFSRLIEQLTAVLKLPDSEGIFFVCPPEGGLGFSWLKHAPKQRFPIILVGGQGNFLKPAGTARWFMEFPGPVLPGSTSTK